MRIRIPAIAVVVLAVSAAYGQDQRAQQAAQQKAQQEAQQRAQQAAQQRAQQEAQQRAQQAAQQKAQQEAQQRAQQAAQQKAQQEAQQRAQQAAQQKAQQEAQQRAQQAAQQKAQQEAQQRAQQAAQQKAQQAAQQKAQQEAQQRAQQAAQQKAQQEAAKKSQSTQIPPQQKGLPPAAQQKGPPPAGQQQGLPPAAQQKGPPPTAQQKGLPPAAQQKGLPPAAQQQGLPPAAQQKGLPPAAQQKGLPSAAQQKGLPPGAQFNAPAGTQQLGQHLQGGRPGLQSQDAPAFSAHRRQAAGPDEHPAAMAKTKPIAVNAATTVAPRANRSGFTAERRNADGSRLVVSETLRPGGQRGVVAYKQVDDRKGGVTTRIYADGRRTTVAPTYVSRSAFRGPTYVTYNTGLRAAFLPGGRPIYRERLAVVTEAGRARHVVYRTVYARPIRGRYVVLPVHAVYAYDVVPFYGFPMYVYRAPYYATAFYAPFYRPLGFPVVVGMACVICPPPVVAYERPVQSYSDPVDLMTDLQIAGAFHDGSMGPPDAGSPEAQPGATEAEIAELRKQVEELQQQLAVAAKGNPELQAALPEGGLQPANWNVTNDAANPATAPVQIPEFAREQMRKQIRLSVAQHQNERPLVLSRIIEGGYAKVYMFQAASALDVFDKNTGEQCTVSGGDLLGFSRIPQGTMQGASFLETTEVKVLASRPGGCRAGQVVEVSLVDLQDMLNAFSQRVESNMKELNVCSITPKACVQS